MQKLKGADFWSIFSQACGTSCEKLANRFCNTTLIKIFEIQTHFSTLCQNLMKFDEHVQKSTSSYGTNFDEIALTFAKGRCRSAESSQQFGMV